jgi:hypothetical protein
MLRLSAAILAIAVSIAPHADAYGSPQKAAGFNHDKANGTGWSVYTGTFTQNYVKIPTNTNCPSTCAVSLDDLDRLGLNYVAAPPKRPAYIIKFFEDRKWDGFVHSLPNWRAKRAHLLNSTFVPNYYYDNDGDLHTNDPAYNDPNYSGGK